MTLLEFDKVTYSYPGGVQALKNVSFSIKEGDFVALLGRNGSGKTTVLQNIMNLLEPKAGEVRVLGEGIKGKGPAYVSQKVGYVFQQPSRQMFLPTVLKEVAYGPRQQGLSVKESEAKAMMALKRVGMEEMSEAYPKALSRGEVQKVAIAIVLALDPKLLILDEPTSGQDGAATEELCRLLKQLNREGTSILLVTHDMELLAESATHSIVMAQGEKVFDGSTEQLFYDESCRQWGLEMPVWLDIASNIKGLPRISVQNPDHLIEELIRRKEGGEKS